MFEKIIPMKGAGYDKQSNFGNDRQARSSPTCVGACADPQLSPRIDAALKRKRGFLSRSGKAYGYASSVAGHIDSWRPKEHPNLISAVGSDEIGRTITEPNSESEVYLDYAGAALPTRTQLQKIMKMSQQVLANPHSSGPAASRTSLLVEQAKKRVMDHFHCHAGRFAAMSNNESSSCDPLERHPGYEVVWTSGTTEALRIVAERFPWTACNCCESRSTLVYSHNAHTSVVGMRGPAISKGGTFSCLSLSEMCNADSKDIEDWSNVRNVDKATCSCCGADPTPNLLVIPLQCNFGGDKANVTDVIQRSRQLSNNRNQWCTMLDLAKSASTEPIDLKTLDPDFACVSFYKLFGEPTGLGALFVKRSAVNVLLPQPDKHRLDHFFGGGSVDAVLARSNFAIGRSQPTPLASLENGSIHFRGIASLVHGFDVLYGLGGMEEIQRHTTTLAVELARRLKGLRHGNSRPAIAVYGGWAHVSGVDNVVTDEASLPGPTIAFNVLRDDGSFVGYNEVVKLASLNRPPIQLRTGCFCNSGACQEALQYSDEEIRHIYLTTKHICGDHIDIVDDRPTGAVRCSFGKDSIWEDLDGLVTFLEAHFVHRGVSSNPPALAPAISEVEVSELYIFPIKSCSAQRVRRWPMHADSGRLAFDREFALVDSSGLAMRLQEYPQMGSVRPTIDLTTRKMTVSAGGRPDLIVLLDEQEPALEAGDSVIKVCGSKCGGKVCGDYHVSEWLSSFLGVRCWLARHHDNHIEDNHIEVDPSLKIVKGLRKPEIAFANEAPLLLLSEHSVETLNHVLSSEDQQHVNARRFRPNIVVRSRHPAEKCDLLVDTNPEDRWISLTLTGTTFRLAVTGQCARCAMVDIDEEEGVKSKTLRALAQYRRRKGQITFGVFLRSEGEAANEPVWIEEGNVLECI